MLGWFAPRCPLDTWDKAWVERRLLWLAGRFGVARLRAARVVVPTDEFFPDPYHGDVVSARKCLDRMCGYMGIAPESIGLEVMDDDQLPGAAGQYEMRARSNIRVARSQLAAPPQLMATLAHELAHELLLKGGHLTQETADHEQVADLLPVFLGTGVFLANATVQSSSVSDGNMHYWSISKQGYLSSISLGYALALFAFVRGEDRPPWASHLRTDAAETLWAGLGYLRKTGDSLFHPDTADKPVGVPPPEDVGARLAHRSPTVRLAALWDVAEHDLPAADLLPAVERCLGDRDADVRCEAVRTLGVFGPAAAGAVPQLIQAAWYGTPLVRTAAARAIGEIAAAPEESVPALAAMLGDDSLDVACAAAGGLARLGRAAEAAEPGLLAAVEAAAAVTDLERLRHLVAALRVVSPDARARVRAHFSGRDPEVLRLALAVLRDQGR